VSHLAVPSAPRGTTLAVALGLGCLCLAVPSGATVPGSNGLLVYEGLVGKHAQLFTIRSDGSGARQLTHFTDSDAVWPEWSPDGSAIAFERDVYVGRRVTRAVIYTMDADGSHLRALTPTGLNGRPSWSPDGRSIAFSTLSFGKQATVSIMPASGGRARVVTSTPLPAKGFGPGLDSPTFSPNGKQIAFVWIKQGSSAIFTVSAEGGKPHQVTPWQMSVADKVDWSPDGSRIAFSSPEFGVRKGVSSNIFTIRPDGTGLVRLTNSRGGVLNNGFDSWSPDGRKIAFASNRAGPYAIFTMNANGTGITRVTRGPEAHHAAWGSHA